VSWVGTRACCVRLTYGMSVYLRGLEGCGSRGESSALWAGHLLCGSPVVDNGTAPAAMARTHEDNVAFMPLNRFVLVVASRRARRGEGVKPILLWPSGDGARLTPQAGSARSRRNFNGGPPFPSAPVGSVWGDHPESETSGGTAMQKVPRSGVITSVEAVEMALSPWIH
jgi:hypothetical protein